MSRQELLRIKRDAQARILHFSTAVEVEQAQCTPRPGLIAEYQQVIDNSKETVSLVEQALGGK